MFSILFSDRTWTLEGVSVIDYSELDPPTSDIEEYPGYDDDYFTPIEETETVNENSRNR